MSFIKIIIIILLVFLIFFLLMKSKKEYLDNINSEMEEEKLEDVRMEEVQIEEVKIKKVEMEEIIKVAEIIKKIDKYENGHSCSSEEMCLSGKCENDICVDTRCDLTYQYTDRKYEIDEECVCDRMCVTGKCENNICADNSCDKNIIYTHIITITWFIYLFFFNI